MADERSLVSVHICVANKIKSQDSNPGLCDFRIVGSKIRMVFTLLKHCLKR